MKKYAILTSVLALAACGGGSGGGHGGPAAPVALTEQQIAAARESNSKITDMNSFIVVGGNNPTVNPNARIATTLADGGVRYDLEDVDFKTASLLMNTGVDRGALVKFKTTNGVIDKITMNNGPLDAVATRRGDSNMFDGSGVYTDPETGEIEYGEMGLHYESLGQKHNSGLNYADFGVIEWGEPGNFDDTHYLAGGYAVKEIKSKDISGKMEFTGNADAVIRIGDVVSENSGKYEALETSTDAHIVFDNGTSTLTANFKDWYDVTATMDSKGILTGMEFANGNKDGFHSSENYDFKWHGEDDYTAQATKEDKHPEICDDCSDTIVRDGFIQYYGDGKNPAEAVGVLRYAETDAVEITNNSGNPTGPEVMRFDMGFGARRD